MTPAVAVWAAAFAFADRALAAGDGAGRVAAGFDHRHRYAETGCNRLTEHGWQERVNVDPYRAGCWRDCPRLDLLGAALSRLEEFNRNGTRRNASSSSKFGLCAVRNATGEGGHDEPAKPRLRAEFKALLVFGSRRVSWCAGFDLLPVHHEGCTLFDACHPYPLGEFVEFACLFVGAFVEVAEFVYASPFSR